MEHLILHPNSILWNYKGNQENQKDIFLMFVSPEPNMVFMLGIHDRYPIMLAEWMNEWISYLKMESE